MGLPGDSATKNPPATQETWETQNQPRVGKITWRRKWQPTPLFSPGEFHGQRSLAATVPGVAESDTTEQLNNSKAFRKP